LYFSKHQRNFNDYCDYLDQRFFEESQNEHNPSGKVRKELLSFLRSSRGSLQAKRQKLFAALMTLFCEVIKIGIQSSLTEDRIPISHT
jgi:hypothetical protein